MHNYLAISFVFGAVIDEAQGHHQMNNFISKMSMSRSERLLVCMWLFVGLLMTSSYKSVLRAIMMKTEYGQTIDTLEDMLRSGMPLMIPSRTAVPNMMASDNRTRELNERTVQFDLTQNGGIPKVVEEG